MKVKIFGKNSENIYKLVKKFALPAVRQGFEIVTNNPDVIISFGGDGTLLSSEREYPGIPKLPIRNSRFCNKCLNHKDEVLLESLRAGKLTLRQYSKLETKISGKKLVALNDFVIRNQKPIHTIRFKIADGELLIGDGIVISTPFGSSGYFKSITQKTFNNGFGLAFNNTTRNLKPQFFGRDDKLIFHLVRGKAGLSFDNNPNVYPVPEGSEVIFNLSDQITKIYELESLRCNDCQVTRG